MDFEDELREEYDLTQLLKDGTRGKYAARYQAAQARDTHPQAEEIQVSAPPTPLPHKTIEHRQTP